LLGVAVFVLLLLLLALNAFNPHSLNPQTTAQILLLTSVTVLVFLLFVTVLVLLLRNLIKLLAERRSQVLGARLRTRMFIGALLLSFVPALFMFLFSFLLMNRSIDRWFSEPASEVRDDSAQIAMELSHYASLNARAEAESMAGSPQLAAALESGNAQAIVDEMRAHQITLQGGFAALYRDSAPVALYELPQQTGPWEVHSWLNDTDRQVIPPDQPLAAAILKAAQRADEPMLVSGGSEYALGAASLPGGGVVVAGLPMPAGLNTIMNGLSSGASQYWALYRQRRLIRSTYFLLLLMLTALVFFSSSWLALYVSRQMTGPLEALADAMDEIGKGEYSHRVTAAASAEMAELVGSFNHMAADLEESRLAAETSARELATANAAIEARRKELETILETIPSGVVTLDASRRIVLGNRAFTDLLRLEGHRDIAGVQLDTLLPPEFTQELTRLDRRAHRMGVASSEFELRTARGPVNLAVTIAAVTPGSTQERGSILVLEDVTELLHAQRQSAWKEVAQRIAHEIRNPLTPITLSTERIRRHVDRSLPATPSSVPSNPCVRSSASSARSPSFLSRTRARPTSTKLSKARCSFSKDASRTSVSSAISSPECRRSWPILKRCAAASPTSSTMPPRPCRKACCASSPFRPLLANATAWRRSSCPTPVPASPTICVNASSCRGSPRASAAPAWVCPLSPKLFRTTAAPSVPKIILPPERGLSWNCRWPTPERRKEPRLPR
jgi:PAS domain S-box-containing protein